MKYATVEDLIASFPHPIIPTVQGEPDYRTIHAIRKSLQANLRAIDTHLGGGTLGHLGLIVSDASYSIIAPATDAGPTLWVSPAAPGMDPANTDGTADKTSAAHHIWEEDVQTYHTYTSVQQALKKQIISVFETMYLDVLNDNMLGFANISARDMLDHPFGTYGNITAVDLEIKFEIVLITLRQGRPYRTPTANQRWICQNIFNWALHERLSPVERKNNLLTKLGHNLRPTSPPLAVSTSRCRAKHPQQPGTILPTQLLDKQKTKCMKLLLEH
jgi:hypothetical protein